MHLTSAVTTLLTLHTLANSSFTLFVIEVSVALLFAGELRHAWRRGIDYAAEIRTHLVLPVQLQYDLALFAAASNASELAGWQQLLEVPLLLGPLDRCHARRRRLGDGAGVLDSCERGVEAKDGAERWVQAAGERDRPDMRVGRVGEHSVIFCKYGVLIQYNM